MTSGDNQRCSSRFQIGAAVLPTTSTPATTSSPTFTAATVFLIGFVAICKDQNGGRCRVVAILPSDTWPSSGTASATARTRSAVHQIVMIYSTTDNNNLTCRSLLINRCLLLFFFFFITTITAFFLFFFFFVTIVFRNVLIRLFLTLCAPIATIFVFRLSRRRIQFIVSFRLFPPTPKLLFTKVNVNTEMI